MRWSYLVITSEMEALQCRLFRTAEDAEHSVPARLVPLELAADAQLSESGTVEEVDGRGSNRGQCRMYLKRGLGFLYSVVQIFDVKSCGCEGRFFSSVCRLRQA